ncbi:MAG: type II toxin-antitoxin system PemK/MazF family toxin [Candidatus Parcubacteria bacterium]|nr:type II toxin-antitoxin system PemK/MazF family toxin [Candidatus Parcubacteria bacterium]
MEKNFWSWHDKKEKIHNDKKRPFFHEREVWFCALGLNIGFEQDGNGEEFLRPVIIIKKFNNEVFLGLPFTKTIKTGKYYYQISFGAINNSATVILSQIRLIDAKRLHYKIGDANEKQFAEIKKRLAALLQ